MRKQKQNTQQQKKEKDEGEVKKIHSPTMKRVYNKLLLL